MTPNTQNLKSYTHCWLHTNSGDVYAGRIESATLDEKKGLSITISPMLRVTPIDRAPKWHVLDKKAEYTFTFESCTNNGQDPKNGLQFNSGLGDKIILSCDKIDEILIEALIDENS